MVSKEQYNSSTFSEDDSFSNHVFPILAAHASLHAFGGENFTPLEHHMIRSFVIKEEHSKCVNIRTRDEYSQHILPYTSILRLPGLNKKDKVLTEGEEKG
jgi:hypothetical protein